MTTTTITKIKNRTIVLPKEISKSLKEAEVVILPFNDGVYIKKISEPSLKELRPKLLKFGKLVSKKELENASRWARQKINK